MVMRERGMADLGEMEIPLRPIETGGMFTVFKVRGDLAPGHYADPGWYEHPEGTVAYQLDQTPKGDGR